MERGGEILCQYLLDIHNWFSKRLPPTSSFYGLGYFVLLIITVMVVIPIIALFLILYFIMSIPMLLSVVRDKFFGVTKEKQTMRDVVLEITELRNRFYGKTPDAEWEIVKEECREIIENQVRSDAIEQGNKIKEIKLLYDEDFQNITVQVMLAPLNRWIDIHHQINPNTEGEELK
jgi:hypothetical protein